MQVYLRSGQVRGTEVVLIEPVLLREFRSALDRWSTTQQDGRAHKGRDGAGNDE